MLIKINGQQWFDTEESAIQEDEIVIARWGNKKLQTMAIAFWSASATLMSAEKAHASSFYEQVQPLIHQFQSMALGLGVLAIIAGLSLLAVKKRWGTMTLKTTAFIVGGVFLAPAAIMLFAIIAMTLNDALLEAFKDVQNGGIKDVMGQ
ncbi:hypothetical protein [Sediminibacillus massiliensis]|uniref:hypothetical protein n=1 Tax=Sediminibacillus massiliensis TaxID=1926277 RepID=UPI000988489D|nr:hypothetical protein [Sediminibacillus massiliensis]